MFPKLELYTTIVALVEGKNDVSNTKDEWAVEELIKSPVCYEKVLLYAPTYR